MPRKPKKIDWRGAFKRPTFGYYLKCHRQQKKKMVQKDFAALLGISFQRLSDMENDRYALSIKLAAKIAKTLGQRPEELVKLTLQDQLDKLKIKLTVCDNPSNPPSPLKETRKDETYVNDKKYIPRVWLTRSQHRDY